MPPISQSKNPFKLLVFLFGVIAIGAIIFITIRFPSAIHLNYNIFKVIMAIAAAAIAAFIPGLFDFRYKGVVRATGAIGVFAFLMFQQKDEKAFDVRVVVTSKGGNKLEPNGRVLMILGKEQREGVLGRNNDVLFENIPYSYMNSKASFKTLFTENYTLDKPDSLYILLNSEIIHLQVHLELKTIVFGTVIFQDSPLSGVKVSIANIRDTTDNNGFYELKLPSENLEDEQIVIFYKDGFKMQRVPVHLQTLKTLDVAMAK